MAPRAQLLRSPRTVARDGRRAPRAAALSLLALVFADSALGAAAADAPTATTPPAARPDDSGTVEEGLRVGARRCADGEPRTARRNRERAATVRRAGAGACAIPARARLRRAVLGGQRRTHHRLTGRRPAEPGLRDARRAAGAVRPACRRSRASRTRRSALLLQQEQNTRFVVAQPIYEPRLGPSVEASAAGPEPGRGEPGGAAHARRARHQAGLLRVARRATAVARARCHAGSCGSEPRGEREPVSQRARDPRLRLSAPRRTCSRSSSSGSPWPAA